MGGVSILDIYGPINSDLAYLDMNVATKVVVQNETEILKTHESWIRYMALPFARRGVMMSDLVQEGRIALLAASRSWREDGGAKLQTYARKFVLGALFRFTTKESVQASDGPSADELSNEDPTPEDALALEECLSVVVVAISSLSEGEKEVLDLHFREGLDLNEISRQYGHTSHVGVQRIYHRAVDKLRTRVEASL